MKKYFLTLAMAVFTLTSVVSAQNAGTPPVEEEKKADPNAAVIKFETKEIDYGTINKGDEPLRIIKFTNTGKSPLVITNCQGSCGCTVPECPKDPIMPGETGILKVRYDTKRVGNFNKTVTVKSNASNDVVYLKIKGNVLDVKTPDAFPAKNVDGPTTN
ncbi:MAG: hypothetical protein ACJA0Q_000284 [Saprospiraceae bacterium]|jgi:hypothetical protein